MRVNRPRVELKGEAVRLFRGSKIALTLEEVSQAKDRIGRTRLKGKGLPVSFHRSSVVAIVDQGKPQQVMDFRPAGRECQGAPAGFHRFSRCSLLALQSAQTRVNVGGTRIKFQRALVGSRGGVPIRQPFQGCPESEMGLGRLRKQFYEALITAVRQRNLALIEEGPGEAAEGAGIVIARLQGQRFSHPFNRLLKLTCLLGQHAEQVEGRGALRVDLEAPLVASLCRPPSACPLVLEPLLQQFPHKGIA